MSKYFWATAAVAVGLASSASAAMPSGTGSVGDAMNEVQSGVVSVSWREHRHHHRQFFFSQPYDYQPYYYQRQYYQQYYYQPYQYQPYYNQQYYAPNGYYIYPRHFYQQPSFTFQFGF